jgi:hypothetical protein
MPNAVPEPLLQEGSAPQPVWAESTGRRISLRSNGQVALAKDQDAGAGEKPL